MNPYEWIMETQMKMGVNRPLVRAFRKEAKIKRFTTNSWLKGDVRKVKIHPEGQAQRIFKNTSSWFLKPLTPGL